MDVHSQTVSNPDYQVAINDFVEWEKLHGRIPVETIILLSTGYGKFWPNMKQYSGMKNPDSNMHFPGLHPKAAAGLISEKDQSNRDRHF